MSRTYQTCNQSLVARITSTTDKPGRADTLTKRPSAQEAAEAQISHQVTQDVAVEAGNGPREVSQRLLP